jgi:hypothetical protein
MSARPESGRGGEHARWLRRRRKVAGKQRDTGIRSRIVRSAAMAKAAFFIKEVS